MIMFQLQALNLGGINPGSNEVNLHHPTVGSLPFPPKQCIRNLRPGAYTRPLFRLNVSTFYGIGWVHDIPPVY